MLNQKKVEIFSRKFHKSLAKQFLEVAFNTYKNDFKKLFPSSFLKIFENG